MKVPKVPSLKESCLFQNKKWMPIRIRIRKKSARIRNTGDDYVNDLFIIVFVHCIDIYADHCIQTSGSIDFKVYVDSVHTLQSTCIHILHFLLKLNLDLEKALKKQFRPPVWRRYRKT